MKKVLCLLLCLLALVSCTSENSSLQKVSDLEVPSFEITIQGIKVTEKDMESYPLYQTTVKTTNSKGTEKEYTYIGYSIKDVIKAAKLEITKGTIIATATDGYESEYEDNIIIDTTLIAVLRDNESFSEGPWLAPCASKTNGDYLKNVSTIEIK